MLRSRQAARALKALADNQPCRQRAFSKLSAMTAGRTPSTTRNQTTSAAKATAAYVAPHVLS